MREKDSPRVHCSVPSVEVNASEIPSPTSGNYAETRPRTRFFVQQLRWLRIVLGLVCLLVNYFLAQYDKFILSYFQTPLSQELSLSPTQYGLLSGYATGIVYAFATLPVAYLADTCPSARVWTLVIATLWWSLCVVFQSLSHEFYQLLLARIGMGLGQSCVEPLSISLISDFFAGWKGVFVAESVFYVGVYIGEAISGQISTAFTGDQSGWRVALRAIGITGLVVAILVRVLVHDRPRQPAIVKAAHLTRIESAEKSFDIRRGWANLRNTMQYLSSLKSFPVLVVSAAIRQLGGNVFGYYMPSYLSNTYPSIPNLLSRYGIIVGVVGTVSVLAGGLATTLLWKREKCTPLFLTAAGGFLSIPFVLLMVFSLQITNGSQGEGVKLLYGSMSMAYLTAELWLGSMNALVASLLPPKHKTFGLACWSSLQVLVYSSGPEIVGLALRTTQADSRQYNQDVRLVLAVIIPSSYCISGIGFLTAYPLLREDIGRTSLMKPSRVQKHLQTGGLLVVAALVVSLFVTSIVFAAK